MSDLRDSSLPAFLTTDPIDILARTLWGEVRGQPVRGIEAVAAVVMNRVRIAKQNGGKFWWGNDVASVCRKPFQFSCWNEGDPNLSRLKAVKETNPVFVVCLRIARRAVLGLLTDPTNGATHYHTKDVYPAWAESRTPCAVIGDHLFYKDVG